MNEIDRLGDKIQWLEQQIDRKNALLLIAASTVKRYAITPDDKRLAEDLEKEGEQ